MMISQFYPPSISISIWLGDRSLWPSSPTSQRGRRSGQTTALQTYAGKKPPCTAQGARGAAGGASWQYPGAAKFPPGHRRQSVADPSHPREAVCCAAPCGVGKYRDFSRFDTAILTAYTFPGTSRCFGSPGRTSPGSVLRPRLGLRTRQACICTPQETLWCTLPQDPTSFHLSFVYKTRQDLVRYKQL